MIKHFNLNNVEDYLPLLFYCITAFTISVLFFPVLIKLLKQWKLFDSPADHKIHQTFIPSMGGVCIMLGVFFTLLIAFPFSEWVHLKYFFVALVAIFITGLRDDVLTLDPKRKLLGQLLPALILVVFGHVSLNSFYEIYPTEFPQWISWSLTIFTIIILTNSYNLIDGLDGLAGLIGFIILSFFGWWFFSTSQLYLAIIAFSFSGAILAFLVFNWQPSKIFMGDTGALSIGFVISFLAIQFINQNFNLPSSHLVRFQASISTVVCVLIIPIFDTFRVIILRLRKLQSPFRADKNHLHHQFINLGFSHANSVLIIGAINISFVVLAWILRYKPDTVILPLVIFICLIINQVLKIATKKYVSNRTKGSIAKD